MISENEICERFGVSRTPVRDALRLLQEQGFVETVPYRGTYVTLLSLDNIKQMIYMRVAVETMVLRISESPKSYDPGRNPSRHCYAESPDPDTGI